MEVFNVLGIEAARSTIVYEINEVMKSMDIDPRHMYLLADCESTFPRQLKTKSNNVQA